MDEQAFLQKHPTLFHLAYAESWPSIEQLGLLTAEQLVARSGEPAAQREALLSTPRPEPIRLQLPDAGVAVLRDQQPLDTTRLGAVLDEGVTTTEWVRLLNQHVFFFPSEVRMLELRRARNYVDEACVVLELETRSLLRSYGSLVRLTSINTGNTRGPGGPARRGTDTFRSVHQHSRTVKEVAVLHGVPDLSVHLRRVQLHEPGQAPRTLTPASRT